MLWRYVWGIGLESCRLKTTNPTIHNQHVISKILVMFIEWASNRHWIHFFWQTINLQTSYNKWYHLKCRNNDQGKLWMDLLIFPQICHNLSMTNIIYAFSPCRYVSYHIQIGASWSLLQSCGIKKTGLASIQCHLKANIIKLILILLVI